MDRVIKILRFQAWERVKWGLNSILRTYGQGDDDKYDIIEAVMDRFIERIEELI